MRKIIFTIWALIFAVSCTANAQRKTDREKENLKGDVKLFRQTACKAIEKFGKIQKGNQNNIIMGSNYSIMYNRKGQILEKDNTDTYNVANNLLKEKYKYDKKGTLISKQNIYVNVAVMLYSPRDAIKYTGNEIYEYDRKGNLRETKKYTSKKELSQRVTYKNDKKGRIVEEYTYNSSGSLERKYTYKYDRRGNKIEENGYNPNGSLEWKTTFKYDSKGNQIKIENYSSDGSLDNSYTFKHNSKGERIENNSYNSDGILNVKYTYKYKYDEYGNWVEKVTYKNNKPYSIEEREYEYYKGSKEISQPRYPFSKI